MTDQIKSKEGESIHEGDHVVTKIRGGKHEGKVDQIVTTKEEADNAGVKNPPKVLFTSYNASLPDGKDVAHNPGTLSKT
ncbi:hypothetical protein K432DRAFT_410983 [Lepidopterella palustris CBS 459.81]|uniref:Hypervirulence associated protein TUDOR domain-containing protein n=1 Tax=Lepidopterella palustris CBS 459.81 TaxID=1314670 RepID=A0A8E2DWZ4_9PEZI|nr:hypothetical protein K432DRAFT_410983 [Lepidopterella palustris CBS 459.81]